MPPGVTLSQKASQRGKSNQKASPRGNPTKKHHERATGCKKRHRCAPGLQKAPPVCARAAKSATGARLGCEKRPKSSRALSQDCRGCLHSPFTILSKPSPPVALVIGYWLTTGGLAWSAAAMLPGFHRTWKEEDGDCGYLLGCLSLMSMSLAGFSMLTVTPLQLSGVLGGLSCANSHWYYPPSWKC